MILFFGVSLQIRVLILFICLFWITRRISNFNLRSLCGLAICPGSLCNKIPWSLLQCLVSRLGTSSMILIMWIELVIVWRIGGYLLYWIICFSAYLSLQLSSLSSVLRPANLMIYTISHSILNLFVIGFGLIIGELGSRWIILEGCEGHFEERIATNWSLLDLCRSLLLDRRFDFDQL